MHSHDYTLKQGYGRRFIEGEADAFIHDRPTAPLRLLGRAARGAATDVASDLQAGDLLGALRSFARRVVDAWAYFRGHRHGWRRRRSGDDDARLGQKVVLARHESNRSAA
jgi:rhamnosyltransferase